MPHYAPLMVGEPQLRRNGGSKWEIRNSEMRNLKRDCICQRDFEQEVAEVTEERISILHALFPLLPPVQTSRTAGVNGKWENWKWQSLNL